MEDGTSGYPLCESIVMPMVFNRRDLVVLICQSIFKRWPDCHLGVSCKRKETVKLLDAKMPQAFVTEHVFPNMGEVVQLVRVVWLLAPVRRISIRPGTRWRNELCRRVLNGLRAPHDVEVEEPIVCHAQTHRPAFKEFFNAAAITFKKVPLLGLASVFTGVLPRIISTMCRAEWKYVDCAGREHGKVKVVRIQPLILLTEKRKCARAQPRKRQDQDNGTLEVNSNQNLTSGVPCTSVSKPQPLRIN